MRWLGWLGLGLFGIVAAMGLAFLVWGLLLVPAMPYFQLDAVLTSAELADRRKCAATLAGLKEAWGDEGPRSALKGIAVGAAGGIGLLAFATGLTRSRGVVPARSPRVGADPD